MAIKKKKTPARRPVNGLKKYQDFMKKHTKRESDKVVKLTKELAAARKAKAAATKRASALWKKTKK